MKPMLPERKIKSGLFLLLPILIGLIVVDLAFPKSSLATCTPGAWEYCTYQGNSACRRCMDNGSWGVCATQDYPEHCSIPTPTISNECAALCEGIGAGWCAPSGLGSYSSTIQGDIYHCLHVIEDKGLGKTPCGGGNPRCYCVESWRCADASMPSQCNSICSATCLWDIIKTGTSNGKVDAADLAELNRCYAPLGGVAADCQAADLSSTKGVVNALDYSILLTHWGNCPGGPMPTR